jgi:hypothetical protein
VLFRSSAFVVTLKPFCPLAHTNQLIPRVRATARRMTNLLSRCIASRFHTHTRTRSPKPPPTAGSSSLRSTGGGSSIRGKMKSVNASSKVVGGGGGSRIGGGGGSSSGGSHAGGSTLRLGGSRRGNLKSKISHKSGMASLGSSMNSGYGGRVSCCSSSPPPPPLPLRLRLPSSSSCSSPVPRHHGVH